MIRPLARPIRWVAVPVLAAALAACGGSDDTTPPAVLGTSESASAPAAAAPAPAPKSIVETAAALPQFSSLVAAVRFASVDDDLVKLLSGPGTFTVFAPTNDAFDALARELTSNPAATAADLLVPANRALVRAVLEYHVLGAVVRRADVPLGAPIDPVLAGDGTFRIDAAGGGLAITDGRGRSARIVATDVEASNGVIHVIDRVILPPEAPAARSIVEVAAANPAFSSLVAAVRFASVDDDLVKLLSGPGTFTVFAPTNDAFDALARELTHDPRATAAALLVPANRALVRAVLEYHVLGAVVRRADVPLGAPIDPVLAGPATFRIDAVGDGLAITDARHRVANVVATDVPASNGVIHVIDRVILPPAH